MLFVQNSLDIPLPEGSPAPVRAGRYSPLQAALQRGWRGALASLAQWTMRPRSALLGNAEQLMENEAVN